MPKRQISDRYKSRCLAALKANNGNVAKTSREVGISKSALQRWRDGKCITPEATMDYTQRKRVMADYMEQWIYRLFNLMDYNIDTAGPKELAMIISILLDKLQLLRNQPTAIVQKEVGVDQVVEKLTRLAQEAEARALTDAERQREEGVFRVIESVQQGNGSTEVAGEPLRICEGGLEQRGTS